MPAAYPQVLVGVTGLDTGPVTISEARLGFLDGVTGLVRLRVDAGGELDFFTPELELDVAGAGLSARILPLGVDAAADVEVRIVPTPAVVLTTEGAVALVGSWLVPLLTRFLLPRWRTCSPRRCGTAARPRERDPHRGEADQASRLQCSR